jgi:hypothetical protein
MTDSKMMMMMTTMTMMMTTDNHGRRHCISYIHKCMGGKGMWKNPQWIQLASKSILLSQMPSVLTYEVSCWHSY